MEIIKIDKEFLMGNVENVIKYLKMLNIKEC